MQTGWRLERTYLAGAGYRESRLEGLTIDWSDPFEPTGHAALWADNGTGKTTITALRFALYQPHPREFIRGESHRSLAKLISSGDVCHVVEQATRLVDGELQRVVTGMVAQWPDGGSQDLDNPSKLDRTFYGWVTGDDGPVIADLPFRTASGRWTTGPRFVGAVRELLPDGGVLPPYEPADHQTRWRQWLMAAGIDLEQIHFQAMMNASEGGVDKVMRFVDSDDFVRWLVGAITPSATVEQIARSIGALRENAAARPSWTDEMTFWEHLIEPLLRTAIQYEQVETCQRAVAAAQADGAIVVADADATIVRLEEEQEQARQRHADHERQRRDTTSRLRRAQAHRLRMRLRAAGLRAEAAAEVAAMRERECAEAALRLAAWRIVGDVQRVREQTALLAGLEERLEAAERESTELRQAEAKHRRDLARLLTHRRDQATAALKQAKGEHASQDRAVAGLKQRMQDAIAAAAVAETRHSQVGEQISAAEQVIEQAVTAGLLLEGADPAEFDRSLAARMTTARKEHDEASGELRTIEPLITGEQEAIDAARARAKIARDDVGDAERRLRDLTRRVETIVQDERFLDIAGDPVIDVWRSRAHLIETFEAVAERSATDAVKAREDVKAARRTVESVGADGLLPPAVLVEDVVRSCLAEEVPAWPGWRWLADTLTADAAEAFARARPDIASGVVVAHPDLVDKAAEQAAQVMPETGSGVALWIGAVLDERAALTSPRGEDAPDATRAYVLLPPAGAFDREAAAAMVDSAAAALTEASDRLSTATHQGDDARNVLAVLRGLWANYPSDPRGELAQAVEKARQRVGEAEQATLEATERLQSLNRRRSGLIEQRDAAQRVLDDTSETRRLLAPAITASESLTEARSKLPDLRRVMGETKGRKVALDKDLGEAEQQLAALAIALLELQRRADDAAEVLRRDQLTPVTDGPLPSDEEAVARARLRAVEQALDEAAVDPVLRDEVRRVRTRRADLEAKLNLDPQSRALAERLADEDGARHPVALQQSLLGAEREEAVARAAVGKAQSDAETAASEFQRWADDTSDKSSPDVEGYPPIEQVANPDAADRFAEELNDLAGELLVAQRTQGDLAEAAKQVAARAEDAAKLVRTAAQTLRHLTDPALSGTPADIDAMVARSGDVAHRLRETAAALGRSDEDLRATVGEVRSWVSGTQARRVEDRADSHLIDLIHRLRGDGEIAASAEGIAEQLEQRVTSLRDDLQRHDRDVQICATMLHIQAATAVQRLRAYQNQSRLPKGLGDWSDQKFVVVEHEPIPDDDSVAVDRVSRVVHELLAPGAGKADAQVLLFAATRALVDAPFRVRILKPHTDLSLDRVDVTELKNFSGGQRVTAGVLLYATMTRVRASGEATSTGWLWLDNPFGQASADQFVRTMRRAADRLGLQLLFTAAPKDMGALSMFDRTITLARRSRPSSGEKVVIVDDKTRELADLTLIQRDVNAVLGE